MKVAHYFISLLLALLLGVQSMMLLVDYHINRAFYEQYCINQAEPQLDCHGKCQVRKNTENKTLPYGMATLKFDFYASSTPFKIEPLKKIEQYAPQLIFHRLQSESVGFLCRLLRPPIS